MIITLRPHHQEVQNAIDRAAATVGRPDAAIRIAANVLYSLTLGAWDPAGLGGQRPAPWPPRADGRPATLYRTGALRHSIRLAITARRALITTDRLYAAIHQFGGRTRPQVIKPRRARALRWQTPDGPAFARSVRHPGSRVPPRPFFPLTPDGRLTPWAIQAVVEAITDWLAGAISRR